MVVPCAHKCNRRSGHVVIIRLRFTRSCLIGPRKFPRASRRWLADALPSRGKDPRHCRHPVWDKPVNLLTVHYHPHTLDKATADLEDLHCGYPSLILSESVYPFAYCLDVLLSKELNSFAVLH
jgi:hypothetical protein